jgi:hypothetical protein
VLLSDQVSGNNFANATLTFDDAASAQYSSGNGGGRYKPTIVVQTDAFAAPAPAGPYSTTLSVFNGTDPNGDWKLFIVDDAAGDAGSLGGWRLQVATATGTGTFAEGQLFAAEDTALVFSTANERVLAVVDADAGTSPVQLTLTTPNGTLTLATLAGLTGSGNGTATLTYSGTLASLNAALDGLSFLPTTNFNGAATITITSNDGESSDTDIINITVTPEAVPPTVTAISLPTGSTAGGTSVTITGTGFTGATGVTIGGTAATSVNVVSDTSITCTTPAHLAGAASVIVTTPGGSNGANTLYMYVTPTPTITSVTGPTAGSYKADTTLSFTVNFSAAVTVTGTPQLPLTIGSTARNATYASGSPGTALVFTYTVQAGDTDTDGIASASPLVLNGGTIKNGSTDATLTFTPPNTTTVLVDTTAPTITGPVNQTIPLNGATTALPFTVNDEVALVTVNTPAGIAQTFVAGKATFGPQSFNVTGDVVQANPTDAATALVNGAQVSGKIVLVDRGTVGSQVKANNVEAAGGIAALILNVAASGNPTVAPGMALTAGAPSTSIPALSLNLADGDVLRANLTGLNVTLTRATPAGLTVTGTSSDTTLVPNANIVIALLGTSGTVTVTPATGQTGTATISLIVQDAAGQKATNTFTVTVVVPPSITSVTGPAAGTYGVGATLRFTNTFSAAVTVTGTPQLPVTIGSTVRNASYVSGSGTTALIFSYTVQAGDTDTDGIASASPLALNGGTIKNGSINATLTFTPPNTSTALVDTTAPTISIGAPSASSTATGPITYTVTYADGAFNASTLAVADITLNKTGTADGNLAVSGSGTTRTVTISSISGTGTLGITIAAGTASDVAGNLAPASSASTTFTVVPANTAPTVASAILDFNVNEDAANVVKDLTVVFADTGTVMPGGRTSQPSGAGSRTTKVAAGRLVSAEVAELTYTVMGNTNSGLVTATITSLTNLTLAFIANSNGTSEITVRATDGGGLFVEDTFVVTVTPVNDQPSVTFSQSTVTVLEDAGAQTVSSFATFSPGVPANEASQTLVGYTVTVNNTGLFSVAPAINNAGVLTFTAAANSNGTATVTVIVQDSGGTGLVTTGLKPQQAPVSGGVDKSTNTFTIVVNPVNDAPSVTFSQSTVTVLEDAGAQTVSSFATFSPGVPANEASQTLVGYTVTVDNTGLFSAAPAINNAGVLTFTAAANSNGTATVTVVVQDNGGTGLVTTGLKPQQAPVSGGVDKSTNTFTIVVNPVNDAPSFMLPSSSVTTASATLTGLSVPYALAFDGAGNLYVANYDANTVSKFAPGATTASATLTGLGGPSALAFDGTGNLFVASSNANTVSKFAPGATTASATLTGLSGPYALAFDGAGNLYVANYNDTTVSKFAPGATTASATLTGLSGPDGLAFDGAGNLYVANYTANTVSKFAPGATTASATLTGLSGPYALAFDGAGNLHVANYDGTTVSKFAPGATTASATLTGLNAPSALFFDGAGNLYVANYSDSTVSKFAPGATTASATLTGLSGPTALAFDGAGNLHVANYDGTTVSKFATAFTISVSADSGLVTSNTFATAISAGPANESGQAVNFLVSNDNNALFSVQPAIDASGNLTFTPLITVNGMATVTVRAHDDGGTANSGVDTSTAQTFTITILNTPPTVASAIPSLTVNEDAANVVRNLTAVFTDAQTVAASLTYAVVANTNSGLVTATITSLTNLTLAFTANSNGTSEISVSATDAGSLSVTNTFVVTVTPVNDQPSVTFSQSTVTVLEDAGAQSLTGFATFSPGVPANEASQALVGYTVTVDNTGLFSVAPAINTAGVLTFTAAANSNGTATVTVVVQDNGGTGLVASGRVPQGAAPSGGVDKSTNTFTIVVTPVNDAPSVTFSAAGGGGTVVAWGRNTGGPTNVPPGLSGVTAVAGGLLHALALKSDGTVIGWGRNEEGQINVPAGLSGVTAIAGSVFNSLALKSDGTVVAWGHNGAGQATVPAGLSGIKAIGLGSYHALAVRNNGAVVAWGSTDFGATGVPGGLSGVTAVAGGYTFSLALKSDGTVVAWGTGLNGETTVPPGLTGVTAIAGGNVHCLALKSDGTVVAWGANTSGQRDVPAGLSEVVSIAAGMTYSVALKRDGTVVVWGGNANGERDVPASLTKATAIGTHGDFTLAIVAPLAAVMVNEDAGAQSLSGFATFAPGEPPNEASQTLVGYTVTVDNAGLFSVAPTINNAGVLTFTAAANSNGLATVTVVVQDSGGTANGGVDKATNTFTITVTPVNDAPSVTLAQGTVTALEDAGAQSVTSFATFLAGPPNEAAQTLVGYMVTVDNAALFSSAPTIGNTGLLGFTPAANANGSASVTVVAQDNGGTASGGMDKTTNTFTIVVTPVNDAPSVTFSQGTVTVLEDAGAQTVGSFATFSPGLPANEASQTLVGYTVTVNNPGLFSVAPAIDNNGRLTFTSAANSNGTATVTVVVQDNGGTGLLPTGLVPQSAPLSGGVDKATNTFTINVTPVNDAPSVTFSQNTVTVLEDAGAQTVGSFATFSPGQPANEASQTLVGYTVTVNNTGLFSAAPTIDNNGRLTFTSALNANGQATVTVIVQDNGGTGMVPTGRVPQAAVPSGGVDKNTNTFLIVVTPVNDAPVAVNDSYTVSQGDVLTVGGFAPATVGPVATGVLANDTDIENDHLTATRLTDAAQGPAVLNANGGFTYTPNTNFYGTDSFTYRASDASSNSNPATVSILVYARPTNAVPGPQTVFSGATLRFSATNLPVANPIRVGDPDSTTLTVSLTVTNGTVTVSNLTGLTFFENRTNGTNVVLTGLTADVNNALESLGYASKVNFFGDETLHIVTTDEGSRTNRGNETVSILVEIPALGGVPRVSLESLNDPMTGRMITNVTIIASDTNLVKEVTFNPSNSVVNVLAVGGQDGSTNRSTITVRVKFNDGTEQDVVVPVIIYQPLLTSTTNEGAYNSTFGTPIFNPQTSLYEQKVSVVNNTPFDFTALRITATNLAAGVTLRNASVTNGGRAYIEYNLAVRSGSNVTLTLEYYSVNRNLVVPALRLELLNAARVIPPPTNPVMTEVLARRGYAPDGRFRLYIEFPTTAGLIYYVQYRDALTDPWKTSPVIINGTGNRLNWLDEGAPNTDSAPTAGRFYRIVTGQ